MKKNRFQVASGKPLQNHNIFRKIYEHIYYKIFDDFNDIAYQKATGKYSIYDVPNEVLTFWNEIPINNSRRLGVTPCEIIKIMFLYLKGKILFFRLLRNKL